MTRFLLSRWLNRGFLALSGLLLVWHGAPAQTITNQPRSVTVNYASSALFTVGVSAGPGTNLTYQWYLSNTPLSDTGTNYSLPGTIAGSATSALSLENVTSNEAGSYTVVVSNVATHSITNSLPAVLAITPGTVVTLSLSGLLSNAPQSNLVVQLFDHDKPVTVANFLHYIRAGGYSNMFFDRCIPGFVLQGGDDGAIDRTNSAPPITGWDISSKFVTSSNVYPPQVASEFGAGPLLRNRYGTLSMALGSDRITGRTATNSATSAFFINLTDNSTNGGELDTTNNGPFTVFGRVIQGTNLLNYFNGLTNGGIVTNDVYTDLVGPLTNFPNLPVNYLGTNLPGNSNLLFCDFSVLTNSPLDTNPPTVLITNPAPNALLTNGNPTIQGTAGDDVGIAAITCTLIPQPAVDGTYPNNSNSITSYAVGTTNWTADLGNSADLADGEVPPGSYILEVQAQDGSGNLSSIASNALTITAIMTNGDGAVTFDENGTNINAVGYPLQNNVNYSLVATPGSNYAFLNWNGGNPISVDSPFEITMDQGLFLTATFLPEGTPPSFTLNSPATNATVGTNFSITGTISNIAAGTATITCQIYSQTTYAAVGSSLVLSNASGFWSIPVTNLPPDDYDMEAIAVDSASNTAIATVDFVADPTAFLTVQGPGTVSGVTNLELIDNGSSFEAMANPNPNSLFYLWSDGVRVYTNRIQNFTMGANGLDLTAIFISNTMPNSLTITSPAQNAILSTNPVTVSGTIQNVPELPVTISCQIYSGSSFTTVGPVLTNVVTNGSNWSVLFPTNLAVGSNFIEVTATDAAGNTTATNGNFSVAPYSILHLTVVGPGTVSGVTNLQPIIVGTKFQATAVPNAGQFFYSWTQSSSVTFSPIASYTMPNGELSLTATFLSNDMPNSLAIIYPPANGIIGTNAFTITGLVSNAPSPPVSVQCQIYSAANYTAHGLPLTNLNVTSNWSVIESNGLPVGSYVLDVQAMDTNGNETLTNEAFTVAASDPIQITIVGSGTVSPITNGQSLLAGTSFQVTASPAPGQAFYSWKSNNSALISMNPTLACTMVSGLKLTATFVGNSRPNMLSFTYPPPGGTVGAGGIFTITGTNADPTAHISLQLFAKSNSLAVTSAQGVYGTTNWSLSFPSGLGLGDYTVVAQGSDSNGISCLASEDFTIGSNGVLNVVIVGNGAVSPVTNGQMLPVGTVFQVAATPKPGQAFYSWNNGGQPSPIPTQSYTMANNLTITATFVSNNAPNMVSIISPGANSIIGPGSFFLAGGISNVSFAEVTLQIFSQNSAYVSQPLTTSGVTSWELQLAGGLPVGSYTLLAIGTDLAGHNSFTNETFTVASNATLQLNIFGNGTVSPVTNGESLPIGTNFQVTATPNAGSVFYTWNNGSEISTNPVQTFTMSNGLSLTATFVASNVARGISITSPSARANLSANTFSIKGKVSSVFKNATVVCQLFQTNGLAVGAPLTATAGSTWTVTASNVPGGNYILDALVTNAGGSAAIASQDFSVRAFAAAAGSYSGLFICTNSPVNPSNSGYMNFTVNNSGLMSGKLVFPAYAAVPIYSLGFQNIQFTTGATVFAIRNFHGNLLNGAINLDLNNNSGIASGTISSSNWSSELVCYRGIDKLTTNTSPVPGSYIFILQDASQTNGPWTNGYAAVMAGKGGTITISGALPDNTSFSHSAKVSPDGVCPIYAIPSGVGSKGLLLGWEIFSNLTAGSGQLYWYKAANVGNYYKDGVGLESNAVFNATGANIARPPAGGVYTIVFQGGSILQPMTNFLTVANGNFSVTGQPADKLKISLAASGILTGSFVNTNNNKTLHFKGAFVSPSEGGSGFIPDADGQTGSFSLQLIP